MADRFILSFKSEAPMRERSADIWLCNRYSANIGRF